MVVTTLLKALSKGIWWKRVDKMPAGEGLVIKGDPTAWRKVIPFVWRNANSWIVLEVDNVRPYWLFYEVNQERRIFHEALFTKYIALRISRGDVRFLAIGTVKSAERPLRMLSKEESDALDITEEQITYV